MNAKLFRLLEKQSTSSRIYAAELLGEVGEKEAAPLLQKLLSDKNPMNIMTSYSPRHAAVLALARLGHDAAGLEALNLLRSSDLTDQAYGAKALTVYTFGLAKEELIAKFTHTKAYRLLEDCAKALSRIDERDEAGRELLASLDDPEYRANIVSGLANMGCKWAAERLRAMLDGGDPHLLGSVAEALATLGDAESGAAIFKTLRRVYEGRRPPTDMVKRQEILGGVEWHITTISGGEQGRQYAVDSLVKALGKLKYKPAAPYLVRMLGEREHDINDTLSRAISQIGDSSVIPLLEHAMETGRSWTRVNAIQTLEGLRSACSKIKIAEYLDRPAQFDADEYNTQLSAVRYMASMGFREYAPCMADIHRNGRGCIAILDAIEELDYRGAADIFTAAFRSGDHLLNKVRAARLLSNIIAREFQEHTVSLGDKASLGGRPLPGDAVGAGDATDLPQA